MAEPQLTATVSWVAVRVLAGLRSHLGRACSTWVLGRVLMFAGLRGLTSCLLSAVRPPWPSGPKSPTQILQGGLSHYGCRPREMSPQTSRPSAKSQWPHLPALMGRRHGGRGLEGASTTAAGFLLKSLYSRQNPCGFGITVSRVLVKCQWGLYIRNTCLYDLMENMYTH